MARPATPKVLYLEIDEEVTSIVDRMKNVNNKVVIFVIPNRATVLQSIVNLKLLKKQADKLGKEIAIVTTDKTGRNLSSQVGITVYSNVEQSKHIRPSTSSVFSSDEKIIIKGDKIIEEPEEENEKEEKKKFTLFSKSKTLREKIGLAKKQPKEEIIEELSLEDLKEDKSKREEVPEKKEKSFFSSKKVRLKEKTASYNVMTLKLLSPNKKLLYFMFGMSLLILLVVGYFVLPNATIAIQPKLEPISYTTNITMLDVNRYGNILQDGKELKYVGSYPIEIQELALTEQVPATGKKFIGQRTKGKIRVQNKVGKTWQFIKNTRFQSENGIIFRTLSGVNLGPNQTVDVEVIADEFDANGDPIGSKANLPSTKFTIPGLGGLSPQYVEGYSEEAFTGGTDDFEIIVSKGDIDAAKQLIIEKMFEIAEAKLNERIEKENKDRGLNLKLFKTGHNDTDIRSEVLEIIVDTGLVGQKLDTFPIAARVKLAGVAYNIDEIVDIMQKGLKDMVLDNRELVEIKSSNIEFRVVENLPGTQKIKVETVLNGVTQYAVDKRLGDKIKQQIMGKTLDEALKILENMPEIGGVRIETWPFWVHNVPGVRSNIKVIQLVE